MIKKIKCTRKDEIPNTKYQTLELLQAIILIILNDQRNHQVCPSKAGLSSNKNKW